MDNIPILLFYVLEISYNRIFAPGEVLGFTEEDDMTGEGFRVGLQLNGEILNITITTITHQKSNLLFQGCFSGYCHSYMFYIRMNYFHYTLYCLFKSFS